MVPQALQAFYIYHNKHFMYPKKHCRNLILSRNAQMQINSCFVHRQPQVQVKSIQAHTKSSPYKFKCKASIHVPRNEVHTTHGADGGGGGGGGCCGHIGGGGHVGAGDQPCCGGDGCCWIQATHWGGGHTNCWGGCTGGEKSGFTGPSLDAAD